jgi:Fe-S cluster biogenesis protein NfuA
VTPPRPIGGGEDAPATSALASAVAELDRTLRLSHAGGLELVAERAGAVEVRFTRMCTGCPSQPLCLEATVRPALEALPGVQQVEAQGLRLSREAAGRLADLLQEGGEWWR